MLQTDTTRYRPEIDGLRAIAVLAVILFHAGAPLFGGGFLGVDVFFVISGYLITRILTQNGAPSLSAFYERRLRRIAPALILVLFAATVAGFILLPPLELVVYARTLAASATFVANFYFLLGQGYFHPIANTNALLHLWSLSVEEQFYLVYPLFLWAVGRFGKTARFAVLAGVLLLSFTGSIWLIGRYPSVAFFFTGSRGWELLLGALAALTPQAARLNKAVPEILAAAALALIAVPVALFNSHTPWPGFYAAIPCIGTALLLFIHDGQTTLSGRLLGLRPLTALGMVSYSLYLWHWPIFVFFHGIVLRRIAPMEYAGLIAVSLIAAVLSWRFVEQPFRHKDGVFSRAGLFRAFAIASAVLIAAGGIGIAGKGFVQRYPAAAQRIYEYLENPESPAHRAQFQVGSCFTDKTYPFQRCFVPITGRPNVVLWGDSHAANYYAGLQQEALKAGINLIQANHAACRPVLADASASAVCNAFNREVFGHLDSRIDGVIVTGHLLGEDELLPGLRETVRQIARRGIPVIVIGPSLEYDQPEPLYVARYVATGDAGMLDTANRLRPELRPLDLKMRALFAGEPHVTYISIYDTLCHQDRCPLMAGTAPVQFDTAHLTTEGSLLFGKAIWPQVYTALHTARSGVR